MKKIFSRDFILILFIQSLYGLSFSGFFLLPKFLTLELKANSGDIGNVVSIQGISLMAAYIFLAFLPEAFSWRRLMVVGAFLGVVSSAAYIFVDSVGPLLYVLRLIQGISFGLILTSGSTIVSLIAPPQHLGRVLGYFGVSMILTNGLAPYIFEPLASMYGWNLFFISAAVFSFFSFVLSLFLGRTQVKRDKKNEGKNSVKLKGVMLPLITVVAIAGAAFNILFTFFQPYAIEHGIEIIGSFFMGYMSASILSRAFMGGLSDRYGKMQVAAPSFFFTALAFVVMLFLTSKRLWVLAASGSLIGLGHGLYYPALSAFIVERVPPILKGRYMAFFLGSFNIGFSLGGWSMGHIIKITGYEAVFLSTAVMAFIAAILIYIIQKKDQMNSES